MLNKLKAFYYYLLDLATLKKGIKVKINDHVFRLPARYYKYFPVDYERKNFTFFKQVCKPGMKIIDIGAHIGLYSIYMQKLSGGYVFSFEPAPSTLSVLKQTIALNGAVNNIEVIPAAVADKHGKARFSLDSRSASVRNSLVQYEGTANLPTCEVDVVTIDDFVKERNSTINFIKIDAEGVELAVLKGAQETITRHRPFIILALHPSAITARNETSEMIWMFIKKMNYNISFGGENISKEEFCKQTALFDVQLIPLEVSQ